MRLSRKVTGMDLIKVIGVLITIGLLCRDILNIHVSKYLFLVLAMIPILFAQLGDLVVFAGFVIPLYAGLPGNLISAVMVVRLLYGALKGQYVLDKKGFVFTLMICAYLLMQNLITGYAGIYHIMAAVDFLTLFLLTSVVLQGKKEEEIISAYILGVFVVGIVMLGATLKYYSIADLMNPATRLGYTGMLLKSSGNSMGTSIDPNFYGMNVIAAVSAGVIILGRKGINRLLIVSAICGSVIICFIGLSRSFVIFFALWVVLFAISKGQIKVCVIVAIAMVCALLAFNHFFPVVAEGILNRFSSDDMAGGNGRVELILRYYEPWHETIGSMLFGIGLFNCHTHCGPLRYLFGIGLLGIIPLSGWLMNYYHRCKRCSRFDLKYWLPFWVTFISFSSIPAAGAIDCTFPLIISLTIISTKKGHQICLEE